MRCDEHNVVFLKRPWVNPFSQNPIENTISNNKYFTPNRSRSKDLRRVDSRRLSRAAQDII